jgi:hypothetical protein
MTFLNNWLDGVSYNSALLQITVAGNHSFRLEGNRFGLGGKPGSNGKIFLAAYGSTSIVDFGSMPNVFDNLTNVPASLRGQPLTFTSSGASIIPGNYS